MSLNATAVNISWSQPNDSFPVVTYEVSLERVTGEGQLICDSLVDDRPMIITSDTSIQYVDLHEFSNYTVIVTAIVSGMLEITVSADFVTLSSGKIYYNYFLFEQLNYVHILL